jgi:predicted DsbA family dithiol-disulfide isomerase
VTTADVFADVSCPYTHVQLRQLLSLRAEGTHGDVRFRVRAWPLELVNGNGPDRHAIGRSAAALRTQVDAALFADFDVSRLPETFLPALDLEKVAYAHDPRVGELVSIDLRDELFVRGRDVSDPTVLGEIAFRHGLGDASARREDVLADWAEGQRLGVAGSPHFFCGDRNEFSPGLAIDKHLGEVTVTPTLDRLRHFLDACATR